jgi:hypothetical protein
MNLEWLTNALGNINYWGVFGAAVAAMIVGSVWYSNRLFGNQWRELVGLSEKDMAKKEGMGTMYFGMFIFALFAASFLQAILIATETAGFWNGFIFGAVIGLVFHAMQVAGGNLFARKDIKLTAIDGGNVILIMAVMAGLVAIWM